MNGIKGKEILISITIDTSAKKVFESKVWKVTGRFAVKLFKGVR